MTKPAWRVLLIFVSGTALVGPLLGVAVMTIVALMASRNSASSVFADFGPGLLAWLVAAAPVTLPGGIVGAALAIRLAKQKSSRWSRLRWMATGAFAGAAVASLLTAIYFEALGADVRHSGLMFPVAFVLGFLVGSGTAWAGYHDLETFQRGH